MQESIVLCDGLQGIPHARTKAARRQASLSAQKTSPKHARVNAGTVSCEAMSMNLFNRGSRAAEEKESPALVSVSDVVARIGLSAQLRQRTSASTSAQNSHEAYDDEFANLLLSVVMSSLRWPSAIVVVVESSQQQAAG
jgi:hypothetical protein